MTTWELDLGWLALSTPQKTPPEQALRKAARSYDKVDSTPDNHLLAII